MGHGTGVFLADPETRHGSPVRSLGSHPCTRASVPVRACEPIPELLHRYHFVTSAHPKRPPGAARLERSAVCSSGGAATAGVRAASSGRCLVGAIRFVRHTRGGTQLVRSSGPGSGYHLPWLSGGAMLFGPLYVDPPWVELCRAGQRVSSIVGRLLPGSAQVSTSIRLGVLIVHPSRPQRELAISWMK